MRDVAVRAGVTASTVSLCLRNSPRISAETRARVLEAVRQLDYRPNPFVCALMRSRRRRGAAPGGPILAFMTAFPTRDGWRQLETTVFQQMFEGARARAVQCGYQLQEFWLHEAGMTPRRFADVLRARGIFGLIVAPLPEGNASVDFPWEDFAAVALGTTLVRPALHHVASDLFHAMMIAMEECHQLGYRRIGFALRTSVNQKVQRRWLAAYLLGQSELPDIQPLAPLLTEPLNEAAFRAWFERERPEVVISTAPKLILGWLESWGFSVPGDVGIVSLSVPRPGDRWSGIYQNAEQIGVRSVDLLVTLLERNEFGPLALAEALLVDGMWNHGTTAARRRVTATG